MRRALAHPARAEVLRRTGSSWSRSSVKPITCSCEPGAARAGAPRSAIRRRSGRECSRYVGTCPPEPAVPGKGATAKKLTPSRTEMPARSPALRRRRSGSSARRNLLVRAAVREPRSVELLRRICSLGHSARAIAAGAMAATSQALSPSAGPPPPWPGLPAPHRFYSLEATGAGILPALHHRCSATKLLRREQLPKPRPPCRDSSLTLVVLLNEASFSPILKSLPDFSATTSCSFSDSSALGSPASCLPVTLV